MSFVLGLAASLSCLRIFEQYLSDQQCNTFFSRKIDASPCGWAVKKSCAMFLDQLVIDNVSYDVYVGTGLDQKTGQRVILSSKPKYGEWPLYRTASQMVSTPQCRSRLQAGDLVLQSSSQGILWQALMKLIQRHHQHQRLAPWGEAISNYMLFFRWVLLHM